MTSCQCDMPPGTKRCHCRTCCLTFTGPTAFDQHILGGEHRPPAERGLVQTPAGIWGSARKDRRFTTGRQTGPVL